MLSNVEQRVCERILILKDELVKDLSQLVSINTADPPADNYDACADFLASYLKSIGAKVEIVQAPPESLPRSPETGKPLSRPNVIGEVTGSSGRPILHFNGHYDVVPATGDWSFDPYKPEVKDGKLYGRGSADMKAGIVAAVAAAKALKLEEINLEGTISFSFVPDEEYGDPAGSRFLVEQKKVPADYCIIAEPSGGLDLFNGFKGSLWMEINTYGKPAHGSLPWRGINAFEKMVVVVQEINKKIRPKLHYQEGMELDKYTASRTGTMTLGGKIYSGDSANVVPSRCSMTIDRRLVPGEDAEQVIGEFRSILEYLKQKDPKFNAELKVLIGYNAGFTPIESPLVQVMKQSITDVSNKVPDISFSTGGDIRYFRGAGVPAVLYGPGDLAMAHKTDEYVEIDKLVMTSQVFALAAMRLVSTSAT